MSGPELQADSCHPPPAEVRRERLIGLDIFPDRQQNKYIYDELQTDKFFSIRMVGVENSKRGMGVATELIRRLNFNISHS